MSQVRQEPNDIKKEGNLRKRANELDGKTWLRYSVSVWSDIRKTKEETDLKHPAMFPIALARRLIECFTYSGVSLVLDPFAGVGSTLLAAREKGKNAIGLEISPEFVQITEGRLSQMSLFGEETETKIHAADSRELYQYVSPNSVDMVVTSPPYWDILLQKRTADNKQQRDYGDTEADLGKIRDYEKFLLELRKIFEQVYGVMKPKSYCCVIVMDLRKKNRFYPYHIDISQLMTDIGFIFDDTIIWDRAQEYNNLRPLGYPSVFRVNKIHEFILIFQKPAEASTAL
ncbi:MAG: site-specific DNA-methyltransferase [Candidatus Poribacteria bacterium]|nr:site-specific DNA-methyltransferase [Candidatus Poribacteria bacterium]